MSGTFLVLAASVMLGGCTAVQRGVAIGATSGGLVGGIIGHNTSLGKWEGVAIGAGGGGVIGALIGDGMRSDNKREISNLNNQIAMLRAENEALRSQPSATADPVVAEYPMSESVLFETGSARLSSHGRQTLASLADQIRREHPGHALNVQGHTDSVPIRYSGWKSNWELGSARALAVLHYMIDEQGFPPVGMSATTFGQYQPTATNDTAQGRQANRRAVMVVLR